MLGSAIGLRECRERFMRQSEERRVSVELGASARELRGPYSIPLVFEGGAKKLSCALRIADRAPRDLVAAEREEGMLFRRDARREYFVQSRESRVAVPRADGSTEGITKDGGLPPLGGLRTLDEQSLRGLRCVVFRQ
jgi:hypothetical protein